MLLAACSDSKPDNRGGSLSGGASGSAGVGGAGGTVVLAGAAGAGAFAGNLVVNPPPTVDLDVCASVLDDGTDEMQGDCFTCCATLDFENDAFFDGKCACGMPVDGSGASVCASGTSADDCFACCNAASYSGGRFNPNVAASCTCLHRSNASVCASGSAPTSLNACAVCCINAGYLSGYLTGGCTCADG